MVTEMKPVAEELQQAIDALRAAGPTIMRQVADELAPLFADLLSVEAEAATRNPLLSANWFEEAILIARLINTRPA